MLHQGIGIQIGDVGGEMRLVCPNCGAQYEVPEDVIPQDGRDVQCSNCGDTWYQHHPDFPPESADTPPDQAAEPDQAAAPEPTAQTPPGPAPDPSEAPRRELDPAVAQVLREEAARESTARKQETPPLEAQPDLGLDAPEDEATRRQRESSERMQKIRGEAAAAPTAIAMAASGSRRDVLPDVDEINSTLRKDSERRKTASEVAASRDAAPRQSGFLRGVLLMLLLAALLLVIYVFAKPMAEAVPPLAPLLESYSAAVLDARIWLEGQRQELLELLGAASDGG